MSEWKKVKLGEMATKITNGTTPSNIGESFCESGIPFIRSELITQNKYILNEGLLYISNETHQKLKRSQLETNDILFSMAGIYLGKTAILRDCDVPANTNQAVALIRLDPALCDIEFVYYYLNQESIIRYVNQISGQAAQPNINLQQIGAIPIEIPSKEDQHRIATILSRYDSLIENYQKQIKLLEEAAQRIYKEWFVELRFPGHENTKMVDGLPEGWERKKLIEFGCSLESGARPKGGVDSNLKDGVPSVGAENVIGLGKYNYSSEKLVTNQFYSQMRKGKIKDRDILIYKDGAYIGRTSLFQDGFPHKEMAVNEHVFLLHTLNENYQYYVFFTLYQKQYFEKMQKLNKNAAQPGLNQKALLDLVMLCPSENFVFSFRKAIEPLMKALFSKANQIRLLTEVRDRLLPRLMGGEMEV